MQSKLKKHFSTRSVGRAALTSNSIYQTPSGVKCEKIGLLPREEVGH